MQKQSRFLYISIFLLLVLNGILLYKITKKDVPIQDSHQHESNSTEASEYVNLLRGKIQLQVKYNDISFSQKSNLTDTNGDSQKIKNIIKDRSLVFYFNNNHCYSCIDEAVPQLEKLAQEIGYDKIFIFAALDEKRDILSIQQKFKSKLNIYHILDENIISSAKSLNFPFLFVIDKNFQTSRLFFLEKTMPEVTKDYFSEIKLMFLNS